MKKLLLLFVMLSFSGMLAFSQTKVVTGKITDDAGNPVPFATVKVKGSKTGVAADANGIYQIDVRTGTTLVISAQSMETAEISVAGKTEANISLKTSGQLAEVTVVTGVGAATSKKKVAIDIATVSSKDFAKSGTGSVEQNIMGQIAGAQIQQTSGQPNSGFNIILRGVTNVQNGTYPMILLDGVEVQNLSDIDPATIDRVEVVKGAAAGFLYGAQGANGVIQVFSKKGTKGKMQIRLATKFNWDNVLRNSDIVASKHHYLTDAQGYIVDANGARVKPSAAGQWPDPVEDLSTDSKNDKSYLEPTYDHIAQSYHQAASQTHSISISGGSDKVDYVFTTSYLTQEDVYSNKFRRLNLNLNLGLELFKGFTIRSNTQTIMSEDNTLTNPNSRFGLINNFAYIDFTKRDSLGYLIMKPRAENQHNPLSEAEWHENTTKPVTFIQNINAVYKFPRFVTLDYKFGWQKTLVDGFDFYKNQTLSLQGNTLPWGNNATGSILKYNEKETFVNSLASIFINTDFQKDFNLNIPLKTTTQVAYDYRRDDHFFYGTKGSGLPTYPPFNIGVASSTVGSDNPFALLIPSQLPFIPGTFVTYGYLVNQSFDYGNLFGINGGLRSDYSSEFGSAYSASVKPFTFYRAAAYFRPSELLHINALSDWKLRFAYGEAGIQPFRYARQVTLSPAPLGTGVSLSLPATASNADLQVQLSKELEIGTDITFRRMNSSWLNKISFSGTYWNRKGSQVIFNADVAISSGYQNRTDNLIDLTSRGVDLTLDATVLNTHNFVWNFGYRMGFAKTFLDNIKNHQDVVAGSFSLKEKQELGILAGQYVIRDINQKRPDGTLYIAVADQKFYTSVNGTIVDTRTNTGLLSDPNDIKNFGSVYPKFTAAFINSFTLNNNLTLSFQFDWYQGNKIYNISRQWLYRDRISKDFDQSVTIGTKSGAFVNYYNSYYNAVQPDDWFVEDGSFIRLRNASLTYDFSKLLNVKWFKSAELTVAGRNLWTSSKYKGLDPENTTSVDSQGNDVSTQVGGFKGIDYFGVPNTRSFQVGLTLGF